MRAVALLSGGLDSCLAVKLIQEQGIEVVGITFITPFFSPFHAKEMAERLKIEHYFLEVGEDYIPLVLNPKYGYGKNMNPCIDCHGFMIKRAGDMLVDLHASFIITGEVLNERPFSQTKRGLSLVDRISGYGDLTLRPLSAKLLPPTLPERKGWVKRELLLGISGRKRNVQFELAKRYGIEKFPTPAGGCLLTDPSFSNRLKDSIEHGEVSFEDIELLKIGRHFRIDGVKVIISRNRKESEEMKKYSIYFYPEYSHAPSGLYRGEPEEDAIRLAASILLRYLGRKERVVFEGLGIVDTEPLGREETERYLI